MIHELAIQARYLADQVGVDVEFLRDLFVGQLAHRAPGLLALSD